MSTNSIIDWFNQDLLLANIFLYLQLDDLFTNHSSSCRFVSQSWNDLICGEEFCKFYFEKSFCKSSEPFINHLNCNEFYNLDGLSLPKEEIISNDEDSEEDEEEESISKPIMIPLTIPECIKNFERIAIASFGSNLKNLNWKSNFYRRFLTFISLLKLNERNTISNSIELLLKPLDGSKIFKLNNLLKNWKLSKLLTSASIRLHDELVIFFTDDGVPHLLKIYFDRLYIDNNILILTSARTGLKSENITTIIPQLKGKQDEQILCDVLCGLFPNLINQKMLLTIKRARSAFMIFTESNRAKFTGENPSMTILEIIKLMGTTWRGMSDKEKKIYNDKAKQETLDYQRELETFVYVISGLDE